MEVSKWVMRDALDIVARYDPLERMQQKTLDAPQEILDNPT